MFNARHDYPGLGSDIAVGDINGDGYPDIVGVGISVLLGNGNGTFRPGPTSVQTYANPTYSALADVNGDGALDLLVLGYTDQGLLPEGLLVCLGNGDGTFQAAQFYAVGMNPGLGALAIGDFDGDGIPDVVTPGAQGLWLFLGIGNGTFKVPVLIPVAGATLSGGDPVALDFNNDGKLDLALQTTSGFVVLLGNGNGTFQPARSVTTPFAVRWMHGGDVNSDGHPDLALVNNGAQTNAVYLYLGKGGGTFTGPTFPDLPGGQDIAIGDVNGDGKPDLVNSAAYVVLGNGKGQFGKPTYYPAASGSLGTLQVFLADLRHDGQLDIVENNDVLISAILSQGKGKFKDGILIPAPTGSGCGAAADYNLDGKPDLAVNTFSGVSLFLGTGRSTAPFTTGPATPISGGAACLTGGDFNNDGIPDLLVPTGNGTLFSYLGNGDGSFRQATSIPLQLGYVAVGDFNHDGKADYATSGNLLAHGNGDGTFQTAVPFVPPNAPVTFTPTYIAAADLNKDGWTDVVLTDFDHSFLCVLINNQQGGFTLTNITTGLHGYGPSGIAIADLNGDGNPDIVVSFFYIGGGAVYLGDGKGGFAYKASITIPVDFVAFPIAVDVNGDGIPDLEMEFESSTAVYIGRGDGTFGTPFFLGTGPSPGDVIAMNLHGQSGAAGIFDLVYPDTSGLVYVLINQTK